MNRYNGSVRDMCQGIFYRMETGETAFHKLLWAVETFPCAVQPPPLHMGLREHRYHVHVRDRIHKALDGETEYGLSFKLKELLGNVCSHTHSGAPCGDYQKFLPVHSKNFGRI